VYPSCVNNTLLNHILCSQVAQKAHPSTNFWSNSQSLCAYLVYPNSRYEVDEDGIGDTDFTIDVVLRKHIPDTLPIRGKRIRVSYPGIPALCSHCWRIGHARFECKQKHKTNWLELVADFYGDEEHVTEEMLGSWTDALYKYHPTLASAPNTTKYRTKLFVSQEPKKDIRYRIPKDNTDVNDLRHQLKQTKERLLEQEKALQRVSQVPRNRDNHRDNRQRQSSPSSNRDSHHRQGQGRGRGRGQGQGRGHGLFRGDPRLKN
jgi:hypothetical protein